MGPILYNAIYTKKKDGAPIDIFYAPEGAPVTPYATGIPKTAAHPNAAKLFMNWCLSEEGQTFMIKELGNLTSLKMAPVYPEGFDPKIVKVWVPKFDEFVKLHGPGSRNGTRPSAIGSDRSGCKPDHDRRHSTSPTCASSSRSAGRRSTT